MSFSAHPLPAVRAKSLLAAFEGPLWGGEREEKTGKEKERRERDGMDWKKHPPK